MVSLDSVPSKSDDLVWRSIDEEIVILTEDGRKIHTLDKVGGAIWELIDGSKSVKDIAELICERFDVSLDEAQADTLEFCGELVDKKILLTQN
jgi:hypothetical protein